MVRYMAYTSRSDSSWNRLLSEGSVAAKSRYLGKSKPGRVLSVAAVVAVAGLGIAGGYAVYQGMVSGSETVSAEVQQANEEAQRESAVGRAETLLNNQSASALNDPSLLDTLRSVVQDSGSTASDINAAVKAVEDGRKPAPDGRTYNEVKEELDRVLSSVGITNDDLRGEVFEGVPIEAGSLLRMYDSLVNAGDAAVLEDYLSDLSNALGVGAQ